METKLYTSATIKELQNAVNKNKVLITPYKDYSFISPGIKSCGILLKYYIDSSTGRYSKFMVLPDELNNELYSIWKTFPVCKFLFNDWKSSNTDFVGNTLYSEIKYVTSSGKQMRALVRKLEEVTTNELSEQEKLEFIKQYCDIIIDGRYFSVLKIIPDYYSQYWLEDDKKSTMNFTIDGEITANSNMTDNEEPEYNDNKDDNNDLALF